MNIKEFDEKYGLLKSTEKINLERCDHPKCCGIKKPIGKQSARRNILKHGGAEFICRDCMMKFDNPMNYVGQGRQTDEIITVICPDAKHVGPRERKMKKACYFGPMQEPYSQICGSCVQRDKTISEEQRKKISEKLTGRTLTDEHKKNIGIASSTPERLALAAKNLIPGMGGIARKGLPLPDKWKEAISDGTRGVKKSIEHRYHISQGRKKMIQDTGGFTKEHRMNISKATIEQYKNGFEPKLHHLSGWHHSPKLQKEVFYRSSYEKRAYMLLDADPAVQFYETESVNVIYFNPEKEMDCEYLIDLKVIDLEGHVRLVEVKPAKWLLDEVVQAKIMAGQNLASAMGVPFEIWDEVRLFGAENTEKKTREFADWLRQELPHVSDSKDK